MRNLFNVLKDAATDFSQDKAPRLGAALAYYTMFSIAPLLLVVIAIAGFVFGQEAARGQIFAQTRGLIGPQGAEALQGMVESAAKPKTGTIATIIGVVTLLLGAAGVFGQLKDALNTIWEVEPPKRSGVWSFFRDRFLSMAMVLGIGFLLLVSLALDAAVSAFGKFAGNRLPGGEALWHGVEMAISLAVVTVLFALIFRYLPDIRIAWRDVWFGAVFTAVLFVIGKFALGIYLGKKATSSSYGAAGSLIILLLWVYYSAQILFFGAEVTQVYARKHGSMQGETKPAATTPPALRPAEAGLYTAKRAGGGAGKAVVGGLVGILLGGIVGVVSTVAILGLKVVRGILRPLRRIA
jgi:membrane protein